MKKWKIDRIISIATLVTSVAALVLVLKRPAPVAAPQTRAQMAANAQSFQEKIAQLDQPAQSQESAATSQDSMAQSFPGEASSSSSSSSPSSSEPTFSSEPAYSASQNSQSASGVSQAPHAQVSLTSNEINAALAQAAGALTGGQLSANSDIGSMPNILDQQVSFDGDQAHGQFLVNIAGKDVWVTVSGHLGSKDGYATFDPTEFKVGDLNIPVSLVNGALQKRLTEQRDRLKLPDNVGGIQVQDGQLVLTQK